MCAAFFGTDELVNYVPRVSELPDFFLDLKLLDVVLHLPF